jgi:hypothetical protein
MVHTKQVMVYLTWDYEGQSYREYAGRMKFCKKEYKAKTSAIMTEAVSLSSNSEDAEANWVEFNYKGIAPRARNMKVKTTSHEIKLDIKEDLQDAPPLWLSGSYSSTVTVTGPSLTRLTIISVLKRPVATLAPSADNSATNASISGSACSGRAAPIHEGLRPLRVSP